MPNATKLRRIAGWAYLILVALTLSATPVRSRLRMRAGLVCEVGAPIERWIAGVLNPTHILSYAVLVLVGTSIFQERALAKAAALMLAFSVIVELEQAVFTAGHCRIRDLLPNLLAVALAGAVGWAIDRTTRTLSSGSSR